MNLIPSCLTSYVRADQPESPRALVLLISSAVVNLSAFGLALAAMVHIVRTGDLGAGATAALLGALAIPAGLAGWHRQEDPAPKEVPRAD